MPRNLHALLLCLHCRSLCLNFLRNGCSQTHHRCCGIQTNWFLNFPLALVHYLYQCLSCIFLGDQQKRRYQYLHLLYPASIPKWKQRNLEWFDDARLLWRVHWLAKNDRFQIVLPVSTQRPTPPTRPSYTPCLPCPPYPHPPCPCKVEPLLHSFFWALRIRINNGEFPKKVTLMIVTVITILMISWTVCELAISIALFGNLGTLIISCFLPRTL